MSPSRFWMFQVVLVVWLCYSLLIFGAETQDSITDPIEVTALKAGKESLIDPMNNLSNWNRGDPCTSNWTGVLCYNTSLEDGYLHVIELQLLSLNLSGNLSPELGRFSYMKILDFMWNRMTGSIPKEIGNITTLELLLLNGNQLTGSLPEEIGNLPNLDRIQIDQNNISGPIPKSFANLNKTNHMNNNSISGQIPPELSRLPSLVHFLLDNNNLSGYLPPEFSELPKLLILQVDNNHFDGSAIPASYSKMSHLLKMSLRNCGLQGPIPDLSRIPNLGYLDLSSNQLIGTIPSDKLSDDITTINLSNNNLIGPIPANFSSLPNLQRLLLAENSLNGSLPSIIWQNRTLNSTKNFILDLVNNSISTITGTLDVAANVSIRLQGNPLCSNASNASLDQFCGSQYQDVIDIQNSTNSTGGCPSQSCSPPFEYSLASPVNCYCAIPLLVEYRLKSPGFTDFRPYVNTFEEYLTNGLKLNLYQLDIGSYVWQKGPRLKIDLKLFPVNNTDHAFNRSELLRIKSMFTGWNIRNSDLFGPYELLGFNLLGPYIDVVGTSSKSGLSKGAIAGIVLGAIAGAVTLSAIVSLLILRKHLG